MIPIDRTDPEERRTRVELMIEEFRAAKERQLLRGRMKLLRKDDAHQQPPGPDVVPELVH